MKYTQKFLIRQEKVETGSMVILHDKNEIKSVAIPFPCPYAENIYNLLWNMPNQPGFKFDI